MKKIKLYTFDKDGYSTNFVSESELFARNLHHYKRRLWRKVFPYIEFVLIYASEIVIVYRIATIIVNP